MAMWRGETLSGTIRQRAVAATAAVTIAGSIAVLCPGSTARGEDVRPGHVPVRVPIRTLRRSAGTGRAQGDAASGGDVLVRGVVTCFRPDWNLLVVEDESDGILVAPVPIDPPLRVGDDIEIRGSLCASEGTPLLCAVTQRVLGRASLPPGRERALRTLTLDPPVGRWIRVQGRVRALTPLGGDLVLDLVEGRARLAAFVSVRGEATDAMPDWLGAEVSIEGVCGPIKGAPIRRAVELYVPSRRRVAVIGRASGAPPPLLPLDVLARRPAEGDREIPPPARGDRVRTRGTVTYSEPGLGLVIQDGDVAAAAITRMPDIPKIDTLAEIAGFPAADHGGGAGRMLRLEDATVRAIGPGRPVAPVSARIADLPYHAGRLVSVTARLVSELRDTERSTLVLIDGNAVVNARVPIPPHVDSAWEVGSRLQITGVCDPRNERGRRHVQVMLLRGPRDVIVVEAPDAIHRRTVLGIAAAAGAAILLVLGCVATWISLLRHTVRRQTRRIEIQSEQAAALMERLHEADRLHAIGNLARRIAHDLNNLLTSVLGYTSLARADASVSPQVASHLDRIDSAAQHAAEITGQILGFARKGRLGRGPVDLSHLVEEMRELLRVSIPSIVTFECELAAGLPPVEGDASQLRRVALNLITNAAHAAAEAPERGPRSHVVRLATWRQRVDAAAPVTSFFGAPVPEGDYVVLQVSDRGTGIAPAILPRVFDPLVTTKKEGTGLGLAAVRGIVENHGGSIMLESAPGRGTSVKVFLPAQPEAPAASPGSTPPTSAHRVSAEADVERRGRLAAERGIVLVVDDEPGIREFLRAVFEDLGREVITASDGIEGAAVFSRQRDRIALVLLDISMPGKDGIETLEEIRALDPDVEVVLMSGYCDREVPAAGVRRGSAGCSSGAEDGTRPAVHEGGAGATAGGADRGGGDRAVVPLLRKPFRRDDILRLLEG